MDVKTNALPRANTLNPTRRFAVRLSLAAGATVATLLGAQALALRERPVADTSANVPTTDTSSVVNIEATALPGSTPIPGSPIPAAPQLVIIRHAGTIPQASVRTVRGANSGAGSVPNQMVPPQPAVVAPAPAMAAQPQQQSAPAVHSAPAQPAPKTSSSHR